MTSKVLFSAGISLAALCLVAAPFAHGIYDSVSLDGDWEMAYLPYEWVKVDYPEFKGKVVKDAIPGYWEDMIARFRAAGITDAFRINPHYGRQTFPICNWADSTTFPDIYGSFFYRRTVTLDKKGSAVLAFEGVRNQVHVWINGRYIAAHHGFSTPFELTLPADVLKAGANEIVLAVSNNPNLGYIGNVCGLTTRGTFASTGGVNGHLELRYPRNGLGDVYVTTAADLKSFTVHVDGVKRFAYAITDGERVCAKGEATGDFTLPTEGFSFWTPESPKRHRLTITTPEGDYSQLFGIRRLVAEGDQLRFNGRPVYLRGVTEHCYFAPTMHLPRDVDYYRMVTRTRKELGFNFVRFHTFVPPVEYLEATDELGMLVHIESPNFVNEIEYERIIAFARRHPSVVIYCTGNETRIDRLVEVYLENVARLVHTGTDSLFSPMSALRGFEYALMPGKDEIVQTPFKHNRERAERLSRFSDLFTSYQLGATSYESLNGFTATDLDAWAPAYCGKPRTSHEICIDGSYVDFSLEKLYPPDSPLLKTGLFSGLRHILTERGLIDRADVYFRNSCEWMRRIRKYTFEKLRQSRHTVGYDFLGDINTHWHTFGYSVGMMDEFYRLKPGETVENVLRYNSAAVLLTDLGSDFNVTPGRRKDVTFTLSNYDEDATGAVLDVMLVDARTGEAVSSFRETVADVPAGTVCVLKTVGIDLPNSARPRKYLLKASFAGGAVKAANEWEVYAFPTVAAKAPPANVRVVTDISKAELLASLAKGERVLLLGAGPFKSQGTTFRIGLAGRCSGDLATVIKDHPVFLDFPHEGYCGWQFRRLMEGGRSVQLEADVPFDPIVDIASSAKCPIRQAGLFEYRVGAGRLLVCSFKFLSSDPAANWLKNRLLEYAGSDVFAPPQELTPDQLAAVIDARLISGAKNSNVARNPDDPSSAVRADRFAQP